MSAAPSARLGSIDALRGITVAAMLLVNNPGDWSAVFAPLRHSDWHGCTPTDLVFPFFLFLVGVSMAFSVAPRALDASKRPTLARGVLERALRILLAGALLHLLIWWALDTHHFRIWGVLQRIAVCAALVGLLAVYARLHVQVGVLVGLLVGYTVLLLGLGDLSPWTNPASRLDTALFAPWIYQWHADTGLGHDPEGLLSTLGALASTTLGLLAGALLRSGRAVALAGVGAATAVLGLLLAIVLPLNKQLWTPSYVLWTGGLAALALWLAHVLIDQKGWPAWGRRFGVNAITAYLGASVMSVALLATGAWGWVWQQLAAAMPGALELASMLQALAFVTLWWGVAWWLDRRRIYLKI
ncbi:heparan-alpha-glucosaminide N-acetyltransferase domain-containing protein [Stenotrophomonas maltophilia]|uniref:acyltransferase family protein n=1 Tax=Stenotrophomonas maltophilia TaxID=40324 RepID=UPI0020976C2C|nr:heparan-alpha-glucosaminide N-acetyltransferase domain-containing protein [Stenotrophomonas maltophilia]MCO7400442.1 heparan-alpha-glucosaminide N-acetyltransferase domain-containing protein [Stenotrophomonas maltophilia]MCO7412923.1 heparan-alpha-glucosaminide N-acetyltransferase domain-containing protein [Stenotrophomonas maltophilia]